jgi:ubiquitin-conjugating enzyme E2 C
MAATKRLQNDLMTLMSKPVAGISAFPCGDNMCEWTATILGPIGTPYVGLKMKLTMSFPPQYPLVPPVVVFKTPIYHPNVDFSGRICLDILKEQWSSVYSVETILLSLQSLLGEPNWYSSSSFHFSYAAHADTKQCEPTEWTGCRVMEFGPGRIQEAGGQEA